MMPRRIRVTIHVRGTAVSVPTDVYADLKTEGEVLDQLVAGLDATQWDLPTPAPGWTIKHQVAHLSSTARIAGISASDPELFAKVTVGADKDFDAAVTALLTPYLDALARGPAGPLADGTRRGRQGALRAAARSDGALGGPADPGQRPGLRPA